MKVIKKPLSRPLTGGEYQKSHNQLEDSQKTFFPRTIGFEDIDRAVAEWFQSRNLLIDGKQTPVFFLSDEKWAEFKKQWKYMNADRVVDFPYVTIRRLDFGPPATGKGNIPNRSFTTYRVPEYTNAGITYRYYKVPQPIKVDLSYEIRVLTHYMSEINALNEELLRHFAAIQSYLDIDKHYMPMKIDSVGDESTIEAGEERILHTVYSIVVNGYLISDKDFEETLGVASLQVEIKESIE